MLFEPNKDKNHADRYQAAEPQVKDKLYKVNDRNGLYVAVTDAGAISIRYNYSINGRQETITFGRYGVGGITLAEARELLGEAKKMIAAGKLQLHTTLSRGQLNERQVRAPAALPH